MINARLLIPAIVLSSAGICGAADITYSRDVRPILAANCFACHGQDVDKRKGDLRLDDRQIATRPAKGGLVAIVPSKPDESELVKRITAANDDDRMPPAKSGKKPLSSEQIAA